MCCNLPTMIGQASERSVHVGDRAPARRPLGRRGYGQASIEPGERPAGPRGRPSVRVHRTGLRVRRLGADRAGDRQHRAAAAGRARAPESPSSTPWSSGATTPSSASGRSSCRRARRSRPGSRWAQVDARLWDDSDVLLPKKWPSFFHGTPLISLLTARSATRSSSPAAPRRAAYRATTVDAFSYGFRTILPEDCIGDQGRDAHESNLRDVHRRYAEVTTSAEVIAYLERLG